MFSNARVILTTSPSVLPNHCAPQTQRIRLTGFDDKARDEYIRKAVAGDDETAANKIKQCISENSTVNDLCQAPFFFTIAVHMCQESEGFKNLTTVTGFFKFMMSCFHKETKINLKQWESCEKAHDMFNKEAFESFHGSNKPRYWQSEKLLERLGQDVYDQYVRAGILIEEEVCDISDNHSSLQSNQQRKVLTVRFYHHLFCEWYAAHYLEKMISKFTRIRKRFSGLGGAYNYNQIIQGESKPVKTRTKDIESLLDTIKPFHLQYIYRFACGLDSDCTVTIADYLQDKRYNKCFIISCIMEQTEKAKSVLKNVRSLCSTDIFILNANTMLQQKSTIELLKIASNNKIPISKVRLIDSFKTVDLSNESIQLQSEFQLPPLATLKKIEIGMKEGKLTVKEFEEILKYLSKCPQLEELSFSRCCLPGSFQLESLRDLKADQIKVVWSLSDKVMHLDCKTGKWESHPLPANTSTPSIPDLLLESHADSGNQSRRESIRKKELHDTQWMPIAFRYLSSQLGSDWRCIARLLGIEESIIDHLNKEKTCSQERIYLMLIHWKELRGSKASYVNLIKALEEAGRKDLVEDLQNLEKSRRGSKRTNHPLRLKMTDQRGQSRDGTTGKRRRKFHEESMELTLHYLSRNLGDEWLDVGRRLLLTDAELHNIKAESDLTQEAIYRMLHKWKMKKGYGATYDVLANCLREAGREDLAKEFCDRQVNNIAELITDEAKRNAEVKEIEITWLAKQVSQNNLFRSKKDSLYRHLDIPDQECVRIKQERLVGNRNIEDEIFKVINLGWLQAPPTKTRIRLIKQLFSFKETLAKIYAEYINSCDNFDIGLPLPPLPPPGTMTTCSSLPTFPSIEGLLSLPSLPSPTEIPTSAFNRLSIEGNSSVEGSQLVPASTLPNHQGLELDPPQQNTPPTGNTLNGADGRDSRNAATTSYTGSNSEDNRLHSTDQYPARDALTDDEATIDGEDAIDSRTPFLPPQSTSFSVPNQRPPEQLISNESKRNSPVLEMEIHWLAAMMYKYFSHQHEILYGRLNITDYAINKIRLEKLQNNSHKSLEDEIFKIVNYGWLKREGLEQEETRAHLIKQLDTFDKKLAEAYAAYINDCNDFSIMGPV